MLNQLALKRKTNYHLDFHKVNFHSLVRHLIGEVTVKKLHSFLAPLMEISWARCFGSSVLSHKTST